VRFGLLYKLIPLLSISSQLLPVLHLEHLHIFEDSIDPSILGSSCWPFPNSFQLVSFLTILSSSVQFYVDLIKGYVIIYIINYLFIYCVFI
jgi:hypothetical protein